MKGPDAAAARRRPRPHRAGRDRHRLRLRPGLVVGRELAKTLHVYVGDEVTLVSPLGDLGPMGVMPKTRKFRIAAIFYSGMYEYDATHVYTTLEEAQSYFASPGQDHGHRREGRRRRERRTPGPRRRRGRGAQRAPRPRLARDEQEPLQRAEARTDRHVPHPLDRDHRRELLHRLHAAPDGDREGERDRHPQGARRERRRRSCERS